MMVELSWVSGPREKPRNNMSKRTSHLLASEGHYYGQTVARPNTDAPKNLWKLSSIRKRISARCRGSHGSRFFKRLIVKINPPNTTSHGASGVVPWETR